MEICNECGRSVAWGSGRYINRVPDVETRREMGSFEGSNMPLCSLCKALQAAGVEEGRILDLHFNAAEPTKREQEIMEQWAEALRG